MVSTTERDHDLLSLTRVRAQFQQLGLSVPADYLSGGLDEEESMPAELDAERYSDFSSEKYWEERYQKGGTSGHGSYGRLAEFKAKVINQIVENENIKSVIEFGCGDGNQLSMLRVEKYVGVDVSSTAVQQCKDRFKEDASKSFLTKDEFCASPRTAELTLSLDVIFHLVEDDVFERYMAMLFGASSDFCVIYSSNTDGKTDPAVHVRHREFTKWVERNLGSWRLVSVIYNKYQKGRYDSSRDNSFSDFFVYQRVG